MTSQRSTDSPAASTDRRGRVASRPPVPAREGSSAATSEAAALPGPPAGPSSPPPGASGRATRADRTFATAELVLEMATAPAGERQLDATLRLALERLRGIVPFEHASIAVADGGELVVRAVAGDQPAVAAGARLGRSAGRRWAVVRRSRPLRLEGAAAAHASGRPGGTWLGVPIAHGGEAIGLLELQAGIPDGYSDEDQALVAMVGRALAGPIETTVRLLVERRAQVLRDAFIGIISHELRTPITTIYGMSQVLRHRHATMDAVARSQIIEDIEGEADRLRRLAEDLLVLSRTEGGRLELTRDPLLVGHVVRRRIVDEATRWPGHHFRAEIPAGLPLVLGEEMYVEQVVQNLLSNAAKYSPRGSDVRVVVSVEDRELIVRVLDEGMGIADESPDRLFELFYRSATATRSASGAGIGLFVSKQLISGMGGRIWARPRDPVGTEFGFALPVLDEPEAIESLE